MNKKVILLIPVLIGVIGLMYLLPLASAAVYTIAPVNGTNITGTFLVNCSFENETDIVAPTDAGTSFYFNGTGTYVAFSTRVGFTVDTTNVWATVYANEQTDGNGNVICRIGNATAVRSANSTNGGIKVTLDSTVPTNGLSLDTESLSARDPILVKWSFTDATSGIRISSVTVNPPSGADECSIINEANTTAYTLSTSGNDALVDLETYCPGTYTVNATVTDYAGNENNVSKTFKVTTAGKNKFGSNTLTGTGKASLWKSTPELPLGEAGTDVAILIILGVAFYYLLKKK